MDGGCEDPVRGVCGAEPVWAPGLVRKEPLVVGPGELSGDNDGKDTRDLAELGVTKDCFLDLERPLPSRCSLVDTCEVFRSKWPSPLTSILDCLGQ